MSYRVADITADVVEGNLPAIIKQLDDGSLIAGNLNSDGTIKKSYDGGATWSTVYTFTPSNLRISLAHIDSRGYVYMGSSRSGVFGQLARSTDNGETWSVVCTVESSAMWYMAEDSTGKLYFNEYSSGSGDANELYAYNIWRSADDGATWSKYYSHTPQTTPGAKDSIRHIHMIAIASDNTAFISFGDTPDYGGNAGDTCLLDISGETGVLGAIVNQTANGMTSFIETAGGELIFGGDKYPEKIYQYNGTNEIVPLVSISNEYDGKYDTAFLAGIVMGKDGVIYAPTLGNGKEPVIFVSADDGRSWGMLRYAGINDFATRISVNVNVTTSRVYISRNAGTNNFISIPDYTKEQIMQMFPSYLTIKTS